MHILVSICSNVRQFSTHTSPTYEDIGMYNRLAGPTFHPNIHESKRSPTTLIILRDDAPWGKISSQKMLCLGRICCSARVEVCHCSS